MSIGNRIDPSGLIQFVIETRSAALESMIAAYRNDIVLPGVSIVGREDSKTHPIVRIDGDGNPLDHEKLAELARANPPTFDEDGNPIYPVLKTADTWRLEVADAYLPKTFRVRKAKELDLTVYKDEQ